MCAAERAGNVSQARGTAFVRARQLGACMIREPEVVQDGSIARRGRGWAVPRQDGGREPGLLRGLTSIQ